MKNPQMIPAVAGLVAMFAVGTSMWKDGWLDDGSWSANPVQMALCAESEARAAAGEPIPEFCAQMVQ